MRQSPATEPSISLIIPCYNEAGVIEACLQAVAEQTDRPEEVIVVDNNCTDDTVAIAKKFPFVTVVTERQQGRAFARNRGFNAANGTILARIDADSIIPSNWIAAVRHYFADPQKAHAIQGVSGTGIFDIPNSKFAGRMIGTLVISMVYFPISHAMMRGSALYGSNAAITHVAWDAVKDEVCTDDHNFHEDVDLTVHILQAGGKIEHHQLPAVKVSRRALMEHPSKFWWRLRVWPVPSIRHQKPFSTKR